MKQLFLYTFLLLSPALYAQQWSLEDCLQHAKEHNLTIKQAAYNVALSKHSLQQSKWNLAPSLHSSASHSYSFGRSVDPFTNDYTINTFQNNNFSVSSSLTLFNGFQQLNAIRKSNHDYLASQYDAEKVANDISINIVTAYLQLLYNQELVLVQEKKLALSKLQVDRIAKMVEVGRSPKGDLLDIESQMAQEELQLIQVQNQAELSMLNLKQLLDLDSETPFEIVSPQVEVEETLELPSTTSINEMAQSTMPEIKSAENRLLGAERSLAMAQGARAPRLSMSASSGSGYSDSRMDLTGTVYPFQDQLEENWSQSLSFSLSLPLFNAGQASRAVSRAKIAVMQSENSLAQANQQLKKQVEQSYADATAALKKHQAAKKSVAALKESFRYTEEKYNVELVSTYEYHESKNRLFQAEADLLQAKYDFIFKSKIVDFYQGKELRF
jgi:outer membrane protein